MSCVCVQDPSAVIVKHFCAQTLKICVIPAPPDPSCRINLNHLEKLCLHLQNPLSVSPVVENAGSAEQGQSRSVHCKHKEAQPHHGALRAAVLDRQGTDAGPLGTTHNLERETKIYIFQIIFQESEVTHSEQRKPSFSRATPFWFQRRTRLNAQWYSKAAGRKGGTATKEKW